MYLNLLQAKTLCKKMGLKPKAISRLHLRPNMEENAVRTLASQHLVHSNRRVQKPLTHAPSSNSQKQP
jgi:hypothetical protein